MVLTGREVRDADVLEQVGVAGEGRGGEEDEHGGGDDDMANGCNGDGMAAIVICERALLAPVQLAVLVLLSAYYG